MDTIYPENIEQMLLEGKRQLTTANEDLKKIGFEYANKRGEYKKRFSVLCVKYLTEKMSVNKAEIMADNELADLKGEYERLKILWDTQGRICRNIAVQINASQSILSSMNKEKDYV